MIKKVGRVDAPLDLVKSMFTDVASWPQWMPGVRSAKLLEEGESSKRFELRQRQGGRELTQEMEFRLDAGGMRQIQVSGAFRKWEADWRFLLPPDKRGTTLAVTLELELGLLGSLAPSRWIRETLDRMFDDMMEAARQRARRMIAEGGDTVSETRRGDEIVVEIFETASGLELWLGGRKYVLHRADER